MSITSDDEHKDISDGQSDESVSGDGEEEAEEEVDDGSPPRPLLQNFFAPPFYGRPPTPLPPSPSLTSLLRPSRPTTPDASDDDLEPVPRASPKVPTYEYYGFVLYLFSSLTFLIYLLWSYLPSPFLHALGIYYYPNRWWSLAIPAFLVMTFAYVYVALAAYNAEMVTVPLNSLEAIVDTAAHVAVTDAKGRMRNGTRKKNGGRGAANGQATDWKSAWSEGTDAVMDVPLAGVCEVLYGDGAETEEEDGFVES